MALIARLAAQERYSSLILPPAAAAPALTVRRSTRALLSDMSRHMNRIIEINPEEGWVRVEAGGDKRSTQSVPETVRLLFCAGTFDQQPGNAVG
ncbi:hypothetical protein ACLK14_09750 [Escherichia coli]